MWIGPSSQKRGNLQDFRAAEHAPKILFSYQCDGVTLGAFRPCESGELREDCSMKKLLLAGVALLAVSACSSKSEDSGSQDVTAVNATETAPAAADASAESDLARMSPPDIGQTVAPGVALDFSYAFSLPKAKIAEAQEAHAVLCGKLGISRCRVTGITFSKARDGDVDAKLSFKIDPALALSFGRDATALVERADGQLESSNVTGEDVGTKIVEGDKSAAQLKADLARIDVQLKIPKLSSEVRNQLLQEARDIKAQLADIRTTRDDQVESLATTPLVFTYEPSESVLGFRRGSAVQTGLSAGSTSWGMVTTVLAFVLGAFGPWLLLGGIGFWGYRRFRKTKPATNSD
jgi:hypothetical protein